jgi:alkylation response protein AidB-like acyl-CoA dehydrogenase/electron transfer flavoprotein alpha subunit
MAGLLGALKQSARTQAPAGHARVVDQKLWYVSGNIAAAVMSVMHAATAFRDSLERLPASPDAGRCSWPHSLGTRLIEKVAKLEDLLRADERPDAAGEIAEEKADIKLRLAEGRLFPARYAVSRLEDLLRSWGPDIISPRSEEAPPAANDATITYDELSRIFPDRIVKQWEEEPMPEEWAEKLGQFIREHRHSALSVIRSLSSVSPALGLIAARQLQAMKVLDRTGRPAVNGICACSGENIVVEESSDGLRLTGTLHFVPAAACSALLLITRGNGMVIPFTTPGATLSPAPAIGFRAAALSQVTLNCTVKKKDLFPVRESGELGHASYLAIALGAGDYLSRRAKEHAASRVQFPGQMLDTEGRDGIAKLGAVKALVARVEAWRLLLETLYDVHSTLRVEKAPSPFFPEGDSPSPFFLSPLRERIRGEGASSSERGRGEGRVYPHSALEHLSSSLASLAFGPDNGCMAYDAGQVFGGFAFSEDDLLSRSYRDSSLFRFLSPGHRSAETLHAILAGKDLGVMLSSELGDLSGISGSPCGPLVKQWNDVRTAYVNIPPGSDALLSGEAAALLLGIRRLLMVIEQRLNEGASMEQEVASAEVLLGIAEKAVMKAALSAGSGRVSPAALFPIAPDRTAVDLHTDYESFCTGQGRHHRSGTFLVSVFDRSPRYVPEMQLHDPKLRKLWSELVDWFQANGSGKRFEGMHFERYVEQHHNLPAEFLAAVKKNRWLATTIPASEDGLGWRKAGYYVLNSAAGSFGDAAVCLLIMANTSIGTTPVLLGLEDELPRVREELTPLALDPKRLGEIGGRLTRLVASFKNPSPGWIRKEYTAVMKLVDGRIRRTRVVKYLSANFLRAFYGAGLAGKRGDFGQFMSGLSRAADLFEHIMPEVRAALEELPRRERAHKLFLRNLGHGGVSAFALTEPTAGSDSGGVKTMAVLKTAMLSALPDGRYFFAPTGELDKCKRYLIDADRIEFSRDGMAYRTPDDTLAPIKYDRYDYATDEGVRYYEHQGAACEFHDIGQVRPTTAGPAYEYYSLTGAKMWITNGSLASQFCLYAQTPEGVTGFMVDRHAEGLKVGADEHKTGQRGSPTNEISLDNVRVPREAVIGYEGHGQVNALETLNVGRCGLSVVAGALARKLMTEALRAVPQTELRDRLLGEAAAVQFSSESLAYYLIGLFDRPHESVRMESAIAKYVCSEDVHEIISLIERAYGPAGQTEQFLLEKARRDARILNIYEGTNEVQRFLILKDLIAQAADWPLLPERIPERPDDAAAVTLGRWKNRLRQRVIAARERLGDAAWSDAMLQPALFPLAEMAGEVLRLECVFYRLEWLEARKELLGPSYVEPLLTAGQRASERAIAQLEHLDRSFTKAWNWISRDLDVPEVRACDAALDRVVEKLAAQHERTGAVTVPLRILSVIRPIAELSPSPGLTEGTLSELVWEIDPLDRSGLDQVLGLKAASGPNVIVDVLLPGGVEREQILKSCASAADRLIRLDTKDLSGTILTETVRELELKGRYDCIVMGASSLDGDHGIAAFLSGAMARPYLAVPRIKSKSDGSGVDGAVMPSVIGITHGSAVIEPSISDLVSALSRSVVIMKSSAGRPAQSPRFSRPAAAATAMKVITTVKDAAGFLNDYAAAASAAKTDDYTGIIGKGRLAAGPAVWSVLDHAEGKDDLAAVRACRITADLFGKNACVLVAAPRDRWPSLLGLAKANGLDNAFCLDTKGGALSSSGMLQVLRLVMEGSGSPLIFAGSAWNDAFGAAAGGYAGKDPVQIASGITHLKRNADGYLDVSMAAYAGKLVRQERIADGCAFLTMSGDAELPALQDRENFTAAEVDVDVKPDWTAPLQPPVEPTLSSADVIIDIGYGVRDKSGMELTRELKKKLEGMGLSPMFGATRKVTQDLKLLPLEAQIGQTGVSVNPKIIICLGISGAPQHIDYLGSRAEVLCFNKDPEAPLMKLNQGRSAPRVHPIAGDLFVTVRELIGKLG